MAGDGGPPDQGQALRGVSHGRRDPRLPQAEESVGVALLGRQVQPGPRPVWPTRLQKDERQFLLRRRYPRVRLLDNGRLLVAQGQADVRGNGRQRDQGPAVGVWQLLAAQMPSGNAPPQGALAHPSEVGRRVETDQGHAVAHPTRISPDGMRGPGGDPRQASPVTIDPWPPPVPGSVTACPVTGAGIVAVGMANCLITHEPNPWQVTCI